MNNALFVTAIGTDIGKTITSAVLCKALNADYWKPIQCGDLHNSDTAKVQRLLPNHSGTFHPEAYAFKHAKSPHAAAQMEGVEIDIEQLYLPPTQNKLIIEGAGGIMVPLNLKHTMLSLIDKWQLPVVVVVKNYLGSINHTLLTLKVLAHQKANILGLIYVGDENPASEQAINQLSNNKTLGRIDWAQNITPEFIATQAQLLKQNLNW